MAPNVPLMSGAIFAVRNALKSRAERHAMSRARRLLPFATKALSFSVSQDCHAHISQRKPMVQRHQTCHPNQADSNR